MSQRQWTRSSYSVGVGACVEVSLDGEDILVRDSKDPGTVLRFSPAEARAFRSGLRDGEFDHLLGPDVGSGV